MNPDKIEEAKKALESEDISQFPSVFQMARNLAKQAWISSKGAVEGKNFLASAELARKRLDICEGCEFYKNKRCIHCGCFMEKKVHLELTVCPIGKWNGDAPSGNTSQPTPTNVGGAPVNFETMDPVDRNSMTSLALDSLKQDGLFEYKEQKYKAFSRPGGSFYVTKWNPRKNIQSAVTVKRTQFRPPTIPVPITSEPPPGYISGGLKTDDFGGSVDGPINFSFVGENGHPKWSKYSSTDGNENFAITWNGYIYIPTTGIYNFRQEVDDDNNLIINGATVISNGSGSGSVSLNGETYYPISVKFHQGTLGEAYLSLYWTPPSSTEELIPGVNLYHN